MKNYLVLFIFLIIGLQSCVVSSGSNLTVCSDSFRFERLTRQIHSSNVENIETFVFYCISSQFFNSFPNSITAMHRGYSEDEKVEVITFEKRIVLETQDTLVICYRQIQK